MKQKLPNNYRSVLVVYNGKEGSAMARKDEYEATEYPGIKKRIKDGKYLVVIDLGRQPRLDKKTGEMSDVYEHSDILDRPMIKGFGNNPEGNYFFCFPNGGRGTEWEKENYF